MSEIFPTTKVHPAANAKPKHCTDLIMPVSYGFTKKMFFLRALLFFAVVIIFTGCTAPASKPTAESIDLTSLFPATGSIPGWNSVQKVESYSHDNLFSLVDGQADSFFAYGFEKVAVQRYQDSGGILLNAEIWQLASPDDAFGLFSTGRIGTPSAIGNEGDSDPGRRLAFWQDRYFVSLEALQTVPDATLLAFAGAISAKLPLGGSHPSLLEKLPSSGLVEGSTLFFHEEISIQMEVWLGGENILGLSQATDGVLGRYNSDSGIFRVILVEYPTSKQSADGLKALQAGNVADLVAADINGEMLGAVFGKVQPDLAQSLLREALK